MGLQKYNDGLDQVRQQIKLANFVTSISLTLESCDTIVKTYCNGEGSDGYDKFVDTYNRIPNASRRRWVSQLVPTAQSFNKAVPNLAPRLADRFEQGLYYGWIQANHQETDSDGDTLLDPIGEVHLNYSCKQNVPGIVHLENATLRVQGSEGLITRMQEIQPGTTSVTELRCIKAIYLADDNGNQGYTKYDANNQPMMQAGEQAAFSDGLPLDKEQMGKKFFKGDIKNLYFTWSSVQAE